MQFTVLDRVAHPAGSVLEDFSLTWFEKSRDAALFSRIFEEFFFKI